jgi:hypothetical protein
VAVERRRVALECIPGGIARPQRAQLLEQKHRQ